MSLTNDRDSSASSKVLADHDEIAVGELLQALLRRRWLIISAMFFCAAVGGVLSLVVQKKYEASVLIYPVTDDSTQLGGLGSILSEYSGLASIAGISVGGGNRKVESISTLQSQALTSRYIHENNLLPVLYSDEWDAVNKRWKVTDPKKVPTLWKANQYFRKKVRSVTEESKTGLVTLTVKWTDPEIAAQWANDLVRMTNAYLREKAIKESERNIAYLNSEASKTSNVEVQKAIYSVLQSEIKKATLARGTDEYAFKIIDPAVAPERPSSPQPVVWTLAGLLIGMVLSIAVVLVRDMPRIIR